VTQCAGFAFGAAVVAIDLVLANRRDVFVCPHSALVRGGCYLVGLEGERRADLRACSGTMRVAVPGDDLPNVKLSNTAQYLSAVGTQMSCHSAWLFGVGLVGERSTAMLADAETLCTAKHKGNESIEPRRIYDLSSAEFFIVDNKDEAIKANKALITDWSARQKSGGFEGVAPAGPALPGKAIGCPDERDGDPLVYVFRNDSALPRARITHEAIGVAPVESKAWDDWIAFLNLIAFPSPQLPVLNHTAIIGSTASMAAHCMAAPGLGSSTLVFVALGPVGVLATQGSERDRGAYRDEFHAKQPFFTRLTA